MASRGTVQITIAGHFVAIKTAEISPGRWGWSLAIDGGSLIGSKTPQATATAALVAAEAHARALINEAPIHSGNLPQSTP